MQNPITNITVDLTGWLGALQRDLDALLGDLMQVCRASDEQKYSENIASHRFGATQLVLQDSERLEQNAPERAARTCFLGGIGKFINFLDRLIASERVKREGIVLDRAVTGEEDLNTFLQEYMEAQIAKAARDQSLSNPAKIGLFPGIAESVREMALAYFTLRRTLEHHQDVPNKDLTIPIMHVGLFIEETEINELPARMEVGQRLLGRIVTEQRQFPSGVRIVLSPNDAYGLIFTIRNLLAPEIFRVHVDPQQTSGGGGRA